MGVAEIVKSTHLKGCPHTFVYIVYFMSDFKSLKFTLFGPKYFNGIKIPVHIQQTAHDKTSSKAYCS